MNGKLSALVKRIEAELNNIEKTAQQAYDAWEGMNRFPDQQQHYLNSLALNLHSFYNGLERIFEAIARQFDPVFPSGEHWHRELLEQMAREINEARPPVILPRTFALLNDFLAFRHLIRNLYAFDLDVEHLRRLLERLPEALSCAKQDLRVFCDLLSIADA